MKPLDAVDMAQAKAAKEKLDAGKVLSQREERLLKRVYDQQKDAPKKAKEKPQFTPRQKAFIKEYAVDRNGQKAAIRAGYSPKGAYAQASILLSNPKIRPKVDEELKKRATKAEISAERVILELMRVGLSDIRHLIDWDGRTVTLRPAGEVGEGASAAVSAINEKSDGTISVRMHDKLRALQILARYTGVDKLPESSGDPHAMANLIRQLVQDGDSASGGPDGERAYEPEE